MVDVMRGMEITSWTSQNARQSVDNVSRYLIPIIFFFALEDKIKDKFCQFA